MGYKRKKTTNDLLTQLYIPVTTDVLLNFIHQNLIDSQLTSDKNAVLNPKRKKKASAIHSEIHHLFKFSFTQKAKPIDIPFVHQVPLEEDNEIWAALIGKLIRENKATMKNPLTLVSRPEIIMIQPIYQEWNPRFFASFPYSVDSPFDSPVIQNSSGIEDPYILRHIILKEGNELNSFSLDYDNDFEWSG